MDRRSILVTALGALVQTLIPWHKGRPAEDSHEPLNGKVRGVWIPAEKAWRIFYFDGDGWPLGTYTVRLGIEAGRKEKTNGP